MTVSIEAVLEDGRQATKQADVLGVVCSVGCAIHCAATPVLLSALPSISSLQWLTDPLFHQVVAVICAMLVARAILPGWRSHRSSSVALFAVSGISLLFAAAFILPGKCCDHHHPSSPKNVQSAGIADLAPQTLSESSVVPLSAIRLISTQPSLNQPSLNQPSLITSAHAHAGHTPNAFPLHDIDNSDGCEHGQEIQICNTSDDAQCIDIKSSSAQTCSTCTATVTHQVSSWSRPLLTDGSLQATFGPQAAGKFYLPSPIFHHSEVLC